MNYETSTSDQHFHEKIVAYFGKDETAKHLSQYDASRAEHPKQSILKGGQHD